VLSDREKAVCRWAEAVTTYEAPEDDEAFERLKQFFTDDEIVELTWVSALFNMVNRVHDSLRLDIEEQSEVNKIRRSAVLTEAAILKYGRRLVEQASADLEEKGEE
jgi:hypothetical protein